MAVNTIRFSKMHGLGNDFMVIETLTQEFAPEPARIRAWANRHTGIGFDQLLIITSANSPDADFGYRIYNADGSEAQQCGNGVRCIAKYLKDRGHTDKKSLCITTLTTPMQITYQQNGLVSVDMGIPNFKPSSLPFRYPAQQSGYELDIDEEKVYFGAVSMGNPHIVVPVKDLKTTAVKKLGAALAAHPAFPESVNVGFMQVISPQEIELRVYERGAGVTLACGSGACAAMAIGRSWNLLAKEVTVYLPGGKLYLTWENEQAPLYMTGPAAWVFDGEIA